MNKIKVMSIFGTRPEAIKMAPLIKEMEKNTNIESVVCVTGQHKEMLDQVLKVFDIKPKYNLKIMKKSQSLSLISARILLKLEGIIRKEKPDLILVHGDTSTTFISALSAFYTNVKIGHVEAGLRTWNKKEPFPEEMNRVLTGFLADMNFAPTLPAKTNLMNEGANSKSIYLTGNTAVDATLYTYKKDYKFNEKVLNNIDYDKKRVILVTAHRRENLGEPLKNICKAILKIANSYEDVEVVYAVHKNPLVQNTAREILGTINNIHLTDPLFVTDMHNLMKRSYMMLTDSGGLQEEASSFNVPTLVLRNTTERPEGLETGILRLCGTNEDVIVDMAKELLNDVKVRDKMARSVNPYGDGMASVRIVNAILHEFGITKELMNEFIYEKMQEEAL